MSFALVLINSFLAASAVFLLLGLLISALPAEQRQYMDPVPRQIKPLWKSIRLVRFYVVSWLPLQWVDKTDERLRQTGLGFVFTGEEFIAIQLLLVILAALFGVFFAVAVQLDILPVVFIAVILAAVLPRVWIRDFRERRRKEVLRSLPIFLDYLSMSVSAGLNFIGAISTAVEKAPEGPLRSEFSVVLRDLRAGVDRAESLERMARRLELQEITQLVRAVNLAEKRGSSIADVLTVQAEQNLIKRFQRAEKQAMETPVKLTGPLVLFIFPVTFLVLLYPIVTKIMQSGAVG